MTLPRLTSLLQGILGIGGLRAPADQEMQLHLVHRDLLVGTLSLANELWRFEYSDSFREQSVVRPLVQFPEVDRIYSSEYLWPFFALRIPSVGRDEIRRIVDGDDGLDEEDLAQMLRRFGRKSIANPFTLQDA
jgi:hypothetical protein